MEAGLKGLGPLLRLGAPYGGAVGGSIVLDDRRRTK